MIENIIFKESKIKLLHESILFKINILLESIWKCQYNKKIKDNYKKINKIL